MPSVKPWDKERRAHVSRKIIKESERAKARLGAAGVLMIVFYADGDYLHIQDAGSAPMPFKEVYKRLLSANEILAASGGEDVAVN